MKYLEICEEGSRLIFIKQATSLLRHKKSANTRLLSPLPGQSNTNTLLLWKSVTNVLQGFPWKSMFGHANKKNTAAVSI